MSQKPRHPEKVNKPLNPIKRKPDWIRSKIVDSQIFFQTKQVVNQNNLVTVCQEANCPNITECWSKKHATFMIMGDTCTRACAFCDVKTGKPTNLDIFEPIKIAKAVKDLNLNHVVITSVDRDDLDDGGSSGYATETLDTSYNFVVLNNLDPEMATFNEESFNESVRYNMTPLSSDSMTNTLSTQHYAKMFQEEYLSILKSCQF